MSKNKSFTGLGHFLRLNQAVFLHQPSNAKTRTSQDPDLILVLGWMDAKPRHIAKYTAEYEELYPCARILAITTSSVDAAFRTSTANLNRVRPALDILYTLPKTRSCSSISSPTGLVHRFFDSTVGRASYEATVWDFSVGLPKNMIAPAARRVRPENVDLVEAARGALYDKILLDLDTTRLYIYSVADDMVAWQDVEEHAKDAEKLGYTVYMEKYQDSGHAAHMMVDRERYWGAVDRLWQTAS
ncbi:hypothetical protein LOCC1_G003082 [Lachnellula occidentalis]|uniref:Uncharacterized protein n=1 Tax=Lachnellula occidentalis TaxID=215460 RepID=A0A8H8UE38_9HELO|nr:hypothetical protein LOCC1_G003082 [Lachnellula occidentalis]